MENLIAADLENVSPRIRKAVLLLIFGVATLRDSDPSTLMMDLEAELKASRKKASQVVAAEAFRND